MQQKEIPLNKINSIQHSKELVLGKITIWDGVSQITIENIQKWAIDPIINIINKALENLKNRENNVAAVFNSDDKADIVTQIERLAKLKENGFITEEEFLK